jgi:hypothetical protein
VPPYDDMTAGYTVTDGISDMNCSVIGCQMLLGGDIPVRIRGFSRLTFTPLQRKEEDDEEMGKG